jgi:hypothetical protein
VGKDLNDPPGICLALDGWIVLKAQSLEFPADGFGPQASIPLQVLTVGRVGSCVVAAENGGYLPVT